MRFACPAQSIDPFFGSTRAASILPSRPLSLSAAARRACQGWPRLSRPPEGLGLDWPEHGGMLERLGAGGRPESALGWGLMCFTVPMNCLAGRFCVVAAALRFLSVGSAIAARTIASEPARKKPAATSKGKLGGAIRQLHVVAPCTPPEVAVIVREGDA